MTRMTGGEAIVDGLLRHGIDTVFGLPGVQVYGLFDAFARASNRLRLINARHEQGTAYMALGYACATGRPAAYAVVPGPGVLNTTAALATAWGVNAPVLCLTGQVPSAMIGRGRGQLHELPDQLATLRSLLKWADRIEHPTQAPMLVARAFQEMLSGRRGPVALEMPLDQFPAVAESSHRIRCRCFRHRRRTRNRSPRSPACWPRRRRRCCGSAAARNTRPPKLLHWPNVWVRRSYRFAVAVASLTTGIRWA